MKKITVHTRTNNAGMATVQIPTEFRNTELDLIIAIAENEQIDSAHAPAKNVFSDLVGTINWDVDPVAYQRKIREEW